MAFNNSYMSVIGVVLLLSTTIGQAEAQPVASRSKKQLHVPLFIFGDSLYDTGNNNYLNTTEPNQASLWPYGETYFEHPTGRYSNGRVIPDFIAQFAGMPLIPPFLQPGLHEYHYGVNFASAGSGALVGTHPGKVIDLHAQLRNYKKVETWFRDEFGNVEAQKRLSRAVHLFSVGLNDYFAAISKNISSNYVDIVIGNITTVIKEIYESGGRKFVFLTLLDLRFLPQSRLAISKGQGRDFEEAASLQKQHNKHLLKVLVELEKNLVNFKYLLYDFNQSFLMRVRNPTHYGFIEEKAACCGFGKFRGSFMCGLLGKFELCKKPDEYLFWDSAHPTQKVDKQMAHEMWRGRAHQIGPYSVKQLFHLD
ncbi:GDSL esterase/lipase 5 [Tripterygium wilfordii]|uniref:GDSL esterase/lipase 5 n=1 Tax=Tripterygium wilfordii TaxID=458696 RepID=A0A7J7D2K6_TRIWF|nr:GDSL esterase/lipase 5-like [Tripterygium wilfordii]KAF5740582.1 GDSL esterase/lipase 5 [Tripterygium wilfordii]